MRDDQRSESNEGDQFLAPMRERATDLVHELLVARAAELTVEDVADLIHAHPTLAEGVMEAARGLLGRAVHV